MKDYQDPSRSVEHQSQPITTNGSSEKIIDQILGAIGITINGSEDFDMQVHDARMFDDIIRRGSLGLGESYMAGWWDCKRLDIFMDKILTAKIDRRFKLKKRQILQLCIHKYINLQSAKRAFQVGQKHYDIGNDLFTRMLDTSMSYSCGYWKNADTLEQAQYNKIDLICQKLDLKPGMKLLDIGCGWGYLAAFAAKNYSVEVVGITVSKEQHQYAKRKYKDLDIDFQLQDYREIKGTFDRVVSVGMLEHVGYKNYKTYMSTINQSLSPNGLALIHSIISNKSKYTTDPWINKYIFVNGFIPSVHQISKSAEKYFVLEDVHNLGIYYDKTLMAWDKNFVDTYDQISDKYDEKFYRMWRYYLLACAALFRSRSAQVMQFVYSKGLREGYQPVR